MNSAGVSPTPPAIRVLAVDDHERVRSVLGTILLAFDDMESAGEAATGAEAIRLCEERQPDVVLMDLKMPEMDGIAATRVIRQRWPHIQVIALTTLGEDDLVHRALDAGAFTYLLKDISADQLAQTIRAAYANRPTLSQAA